MIRMIASLAFLGLASAFGYLYYVEYFRWRDCFNELGRCFDDGAGVVYLEQSGAVWLLLALLALMAGLYSAWRPSRTKR